MTPEQAVKFLKETYDDPGICAIVDSYINTSNTCLGHSDGRHIEDFDGSCMGKDCTFRFRSAINNNRS